MGGVGARESGLASLRQRAWRRAFDALTDADREGSLDPPVLTDLATAAYLVGAEVESTSAWSRAFRGFAEEGNAERAARCAFWLSLTSLLRGDVAQAQGWLARLERTLDAIPAPSAEHGYHLVLTYLPLRFAGKLDEAAATAARSVEVGQSSADPDLLSLALLNEGQALMLLGRHDEGAKRLDEAMVGVVGGETSAITAGIVYCAVIVTCRDAADVRRAHEWTASLDDWCRDQPELVPFRGQCLVHRSEIKQLRGDWHEAIADAKRACSSLTEPPQAALGMAHYQRGEMHRLRGEFDEAEEAYRAASRAGYEPQPGRALLRSAEGRPQAAAPAIRRALEGASTAAARGEVLAATVEITLAVGRPEEASGAAAELASIAERTGSILLQARAATARAAVAVATGDPRAALPLLREALATWGDLRARYEIARTRVLAGHAHRLLGETEEADQAFALARETFEALGATPALRTLEAQQTGSGLLSAREQEVLRAVAQGLTNRQVAGRLSISEKTVERHLSNIFVKLEVGSRAAATAAAYENDLL